MSKFKSRMSILLALLLGVSMLFAGCTSQEEGSGNGTTTTTTTRADSEATTGDEGDNQEESKDEPEEVDLFWYQLLPEQRDHEMVMDKVKEYVKEKLNANLEIRSLGWGNYADKVTTAISANEKFDMLWIASWMVGYADMANKGALMPLDDLLNEYAPGTKSLLSDEKWELANVKGQIYGIPCYQIMASQGGIWFKKELAEKHGFDTSNVKTYSDLEAFMKTIKDNEPDITPLALKGNYFHYMDNTFPLWSKEVRYVGPQCQVYAEDPTKVLSDKLDPEPVDLLLKSYDIARAWYNKGYVRQDMLTIEDLNPEIKAGNYACGFCTYKPGIVGELNELYGFDVEVVPLGKPKIQSVTSTMLSISATSQNPERAMMLIELLNTDKYFYNLLANGIEGKHYVKTGDNRISRVEDNGYQPGLDWALGNTTLGYITPGKPDNVHEMTREINDNAEVEIMADFVFDPEKVKNQKAVIDSLTTEYANPLSVGVLDPDEYFPILVEKMKNAGLEELKAEVQRQVDAYWEKKNNE